jgi:hypothetical protein
MSNRFFRFVSCTWHLALAILVAASIVAGCERKERVLDVRTPGGDVTVDRNIDNGRVDVKTTNK